jgi:hypothetical protein
MRRIFIVLFLTTLVLNIINCQTYINDANISGHWNRNNSPYIVNCNIIINSTDSLLIEPGVKVLFAGDYSLNIDGTIIANGVKGDSIYFTAFDTSIRWHGVVFNNSSIVSKSSFSFCVIEYAGDKYMTDEGVRFTINSGGGIAINGGSPLVISNCIIRHNKATGGGGIYNNNSNAKIINSIIDHNEGYIGGAIYVKDSTVLKGCVISNNISHLEGIIQSEQYMSIKLINCTVVKNTTLSIGGELLWVKGECFLLNTIIYDNSPSAGRFGWFDLTVRNCNIEGGEDAFRLNFTNLSYENNLSTFPVFEDYPKGNFNLKICSCINKGSPDFTDADLTKDILGNPRIYSETNSCVDIGAYEYQNSITNYPPVIEPLEKQYVIKNSKRKISVKYYDADINDIQTLTLITRNENLKPSIISSNKGDFSILVDAENNWEGESYLVMEINDNSYQPQAIYVDSVLVHVGNEFKGLINYNEVFSDTIKIIGDVTIDSEGILQIKDGSYIEFQDHYKISSYGRINALGFQNSRIEFNAVDTATTYRDDSRIENGWGGIEFINTQMTDTSIINYCDFTNTGYTNITFYRSPTNGTINIVHSNNIFLNHCNFYSNYSMSEDRNCGVFLDSSNNVTIYNCKFYNSYTTVFQGIYVYSLNSQLEIDSCEFNKQECRTGYIYCRESQLSLKNSRLNNNDDASSVLFLWLGKAVIEGNQFINNNAIGIELNSVDTVYVRNNLIIGNNKGLLTYGCLFPCISGNIFAYNKLSCNCSNFFGVAVDMKGSGGFITNNTFYKNIQDSNGDAVYLSYSYPTVINNIFWQNHGTGVRWYNGADIGVPDPVIQNNYSLNPEFILIDSIDLRLKNNSHCVDKGIAVPNQYLLDIDINGNSRIDTINNTIDIGAIELQDPTEKIINSILKQSEGLSIYPNPVKDEIVLINMGIISSYEIFDIRGICIQTGINAENLIDVSEIHQGIYILKLEKDGKYFITKFLKK